MCFLYFTLVLVLMLMLANLNTMPVLFLLKMKFLLNLSSSPIILRISNHFSKPLTTDAKRKSKIHKTKNDKKDTFIICLVLFDRDYTS